MAPAETTAIASRNDRESPLLKLPGEIRNRIYRYAAVNSTVIHLHPDMAKPRHPNIMLACRRLYSEVRASYYEANEFSFTFNQAFTSDFVRRFQRRAGSSSAKVMSVRVTRHFRTVPTTTSSIWTRLRIAIGHDKLLHLEIISKSISGSAGGFCFNAEPCYCKLQEMSALCNGTNAPLFRFLEEYAMFMRAGKSAKDVREVSLCDKCGLPTTSTER